MISVVEIYWVEGASIAGAPAIQGVKVQLPKTNIVCVVGLGIIL